MPLPQLLRDASIADLNDKIALVPLEQRQQGYLLRHDP